MGVAFFSVFLSSTHRTRICRPVELVKIDRRPPHMPRAQPRKKKQVRVEVLAYERAACAM